MSDVSTAVNRPAQEASRMTRTMARKRWFLFPLIVLSMIAAACGSSGNSSSKSSSGGGSTTTTAKQAKLASTTLNGSGSTFQQPFDEAAIQGFTSEQPAVTINYGGGGSGKGQTDLQGKLVDFAGTDALPKPEDLPKYTGGALLYFPTVGAPITVSYNVKGVDKLQLSADTIAGIFQGDIKTWNDPKIKADNPDANLPSTAIVVAHRSDASGTTNNFTKYLTLAAPSAWKLGTGTTVPWPAGEQAGNGNPGVAQIVKSSDGAIGYVDYSDAKGAGLTFAAVKNSEGNYVQPTLEAASAALQGADVAPDLSYNPMNAAGAKTYPITSPTWIMVYKNQTDATKGAAVKAFLTYILGPGQDLAEQAEYAKLPSNLQSKAQAQLDQIVVPQQ